MRIPSARGEHAGTYSCLANNSLGDSAEVTALLVVTGLVPRFAQSPVSYIEMEPLADVYLNTDIEIDFRPEAANGERGRVERAVHFEGHFGFSEF